MLDYNYEIIEVRPELNHMTVKFTSKDESHQVMTVGTPLPTEGMSLDDFLIPYAPHAIWYEQDRNKFIPEVGQTGEFSAEEFAAKQKAIQDAEAAAFFEQIKKQNQERGPDYRSLANTQSVSDPGVTDPLAEKTPVKTI